MNALPDLSQLTHLEKDGLIRLLFEQNQQLARQLATVQSQLLALEGKAKSLEDKLHKHSGNSSKPPSSDGFKKPAPKSRRPRGQRQSGGQVGHQGTTLKRVAMPDKVIALPVTRCRHCDSGHLSAGTIASTRQVFDIPPLKLEVTEYQAESKQCHDCGRVSRAAFPIFATQPVQYGPELRSVMVYLHQYQLLPYERLAACFKDLFNQSLSQGTLYNTSQRAFSALDEVEQQLKQALINSDMRHADETGLRYNKTLQWLHVASNPRYTHYHVHRKRGQDGIAPGGILPHFKGALVHDHFKAYYHYGATHGLCNAHILRELTFLQEQYQCKWAGRMERFLLRLKQDVETHYANTGQALDEAAQKTWRHRFANILYKGRQEWPKRKPAPGRKQVEQPKPVCLLERLRLHHNDVLRFMSDPTVPFDNNLAERDIRMMKVKQKISGCDGSESGTRTFCRIRSYIPTLRKNNRSIIEGLRDVFYDRPKLVGLLA